MLPDLALAMVLDEMRAGGRVLVVCETGADVKATIHQLAAEAHHGERVRFAQGDETMSSPGDRGRIQLTTGRRAPLHTRGMNIDLAMVAAFPNRDVIVALTIAAAASQRGRIMAAPDLRTLWPASAHGAAPVVGASQR